MTQVTRLHALKLDQRGLARVFGELEAEIMDVIWRHGECSVGAVCGCLGHDANYKTVMTVMNRLVDKRVLTRRRESRAFLYAAPESRDQLLSRVYRRVVEGLLQDFGEAALAHFVDAVDAVDPDLVSELEQLARRRCEDGADSAP